MDISLVCPIDPGGLPKDMRRGMESIANRVAAASAARGLGKDLILRIYLAGIHHGVKLGAETPSRPTERPRDEQG